jgi:adenosylcobinamide kinase/adenosylcobinamide-phosphate guanylyltransferase
VPGDANELILKLDVYMPSVPQSVPRSVEITPSRQKKTAYSHPKPPMKPSESKLIFVLGGARSGKSSFALQQGKTRSPRAFLATAEPLDSEMALRIRAHKRSRGRGWVTFEIPTNLAGWFMADGERYSSVVVDCLTLWLNNLLREKVRPAQALTHVRKFLRSTRGSSGQVVVVSNELGLGLVPRDGASRQFRDLAGRMNQLVAAEADEVYFLLSGFPLRLK